MPRSSFYYRPRPVSPADLLVMRALDEIYTATPFYGSRRMQVVLQRRGLPVNRKRVQRLMRVMGLEAVGPKPRLSRPHPEHRVYPYLLRDVAIERVDQVWSTDITYIRLRSGFVYLVAILDWFSRYVLAWELSVTVDGQFCEDTLARALATGPSDDYQYGPGEPVHQHGVHGSVADGGRPDQHGWARPGLGQCVRRAPLAFSQVRRRVSEGLCLGARRARAAGPVLHLLQSGTAASGVGLSHARGGVRRGPGRVGAVSRGEEMTNTGYGNVESSHTTRPSHIPTAIIQGHTNEDDINLSGPENCLDNGVHLGARRAFSPVAPQDAPWGRSAPLAWASHKTCESGEFHTTNTT